MLIKGQLLTATNLNSAYLSKINASSQTVIGPVTFLQSITGNISTASAWATGRTISLTGDIVGTSSAWTGSSNLSFAATIANKAVTYAKIQDVTANRILGRITTNGVVQELTAANVRSIINVADGADKYDQWKLHTNDVFRANIASDNIVNLKAGTNVSLSYSATNNTITISSTDTNTATAVDNILDGSNSGTAITYAPYTTNLSATGNRFYTNDTLPTATSLLNLSSHLRVTTLTANTGGISSFGDITIAKNNPWLTIESPNVGAETNEQSAGISIGEGGYKGNASLHLTYTGDGYGHIGMGSVATNNIPTNRSMRFYYGSKDVYFDGKINVTDDILGNNKVAIRTSDGWLRLNPDSDFATGTYSPKGIRADGGLASGSYTLSPGEVRADYFRGGSSSYYVSPANTGTAGLFAGNIGIGTTSPSAKIHISQSGAYDFIDLERTQAGYEAKWGIHLGYGRFNIGLEDTYNLVIDKSGNVGIGSFTSVAPSYKLDVLGDINFTGTLQGGTVPWARLSGIPSITAGNGLTGGGDLSTNRTVTLGTPGTITGSTTNSVTSTSHTHALTLPTITYSMTNFANQNLSTSNSPTFAGVTVTGKATSNQGFKTGDFEIVYDSISKCLQFNFTG